MSTVTKFGVHQPAETPKEPLPAIPNAAIGTEVSTINDILLVLRMYGLIEP